MKNINKEQNNRISNIKNDIYPTYNNPSYDKSLSIEKRLYDFLGKYYINLNGVKPNNIPEITQPHKKEVVDFVLELLSQSEQEIYYKFLKEFEFNAETDNFELDVVKSEKLFSKIKCQEFFGVNEKQFNILKQRQKLVGYKSTTKKIKCANCGQKTGFYPNDFDKNTDLTDIFCSEECRYNFETGKPGEEY